MNRAEAWVAFAAAGLANSDTYFPVAQIADRMLAEFDKRFTHEDKCPWRIGDACSCRVSSAK